MTVGDCLCFEYIYICIGYILPTIGGYIKNFHGVKLSAVPNCPFWHMVPNCPVPNYSGSKLSVNMGGAKLSWCQIVLGPTVLLVLYKFAIKYENINLKICWMLILNFCQDMDLSESSRSSSQWAGSSFLDRIVRGLCCLFLKYQFWQQYRTTLSVIKPYKFWLIWVRKKLLLQTFCPVEGGRALATGQQPGSQLPFCCVLRFYNKDQTTYFYMVHILIWTLSELN